MSTKYNEMCPEIEKSIIIREKTKWFNSEIKEAKKYRRKMEDKWKRNKSVENWEIYKRIRNNYYTLIEKNKKKYYNEKFQNSRNSKEIHKNLEELLGLKKEKVFPDEPSEPRCLADEFVEFFENKVEKICAEIEIESLEEYPNMPQIEYRKLKKFTKLKINENLKS